MTSMGRAITASVYAVVLRKDTPSPVAPGERRGIRRDRDPDRRSQHASTTSRRRSGSTSPASISASSRCRSSGRTTRGSRSARRDSCSWRRNSVGQSDDDLVDDNPPASEVTHFDLKTRKTEKFLERIDAGGGAYDALVTFSISADGTKILYAADHQWFVVAAEHPPKPGEGPIKTAGLEVWVDPRAEWHQMFHEVWRIERDFLYDPHAHGLDLAAAERLYAPFVDGSLAGATISTRCSRRCSEISCSVTCLSTAARCRNSRGSRSACSGADYTVDHGRYKIARILRGENWNPHLRRTAHAARRDRQGGRARCSQVDGRELFATNAVEQCRSSAPPAASRPSSRSHRRPTARMRARSRWCRWRSGHPAPAAHVEWKTTASASISSPAVVSATCSFRIPAPAGSPSFNRYFTSQVSKDAESCSTSASITADRSPTT